MTKHSKLKVQFICKTRLKALGKAVNSDKSTADFSIFDQNFAESEKKRKILKMAWNVKIHDKKSADVSIFFADVSIFAELAILRINKHKTMTNTLIKLL